MAPEMTIGEIKRLTLADFEVMQQAYKLRQVDDAFFAAKQAWLNNLAGATDKKGHPIYKRFDQFYDYEKQVELAWDKKNTRVVKRNSLKLISLANRMIGGEMSGR